MSPSSIVAIQRRTGKLAAAALIALVLGAASRVALSQAHHEHVSDRPTRSATASDHKVGHGDADAQLRLGAEAFRKGALSSAISHWQKAALGYRHAGNAPAQTDVLLNLAG